ncbi:MAG: hypothetical protein AAFP77_08405 [Bacteroidota bacterium]
MLTTRNITPEDQANRLNESLDQLETTRSEGIQTSRRLQRTKAIANEREKARLKRKYGANNPKAKRKEQRAKSYSETNKAFQEQNKRSISKPKAFRSTDWGVYGTVVNDKQQRMPDLTISFADESGTWIQPLDFVCTEENGFFRYAIDDPEGEWIKDFGRSVYLTVSDKDRNVLYREDKAMVFLEPKMVERQIVLPSEACTAPPTEPTEPTEPTPDQYCIKGKVSVKKPEHLLGLTIEAYDHKVVDEFKIKAAEVDEETGSFEIYYQQEDLTNSSITAGNIEIVLLVRNPNNEGIKVSGPYRDVPPQLEVHIELE